MNRQHTQIDAHKEAQKLQEHINAILSTGYSAKDFIHIAAAIILRNELKEMAASGTPITPDSLMSHVVGDAEMGSGVSNAQTPERSWTS